jgi:hypothetical protein
MNLNMSTLTSGVSPAVCRAISGFGNNLYQIGTTLSIANEKGVPYSIIKPKSDGYFQEIRNFGGHYTPIQDGLPKSICEIFPEVPWVDYKKGTDQLISSYIFDFLVMEENIESIKKVLTPVPSIAEYIEKKGYNSFDLGIHLRFKGGSDSFNPEPINEEWLISVLEKEESVSRNVVIVSNRYAPSNELIVQWREKFPNTTFTLIRSEPVFIDFFVLANCKRVVCGNSTFSFWTGILGVEKEKVYMTPGYTPCMCSTAVPSYWET